MGFLTPILIRNDSAHQIKENSEEFAKRVYDVVCNFRPESLPLAHHCNAMESLGARHADVDRVIVVHGNTWVDLSSEACEIEKTDSVYISYLEDCLKIAKSAVSQLQKKLNELKKENR